MRSDIEKFRSDPIRVEEWRQILNLDITKEVLGLLNKRGPRFARIERVSWSAVDTGIALGEEQGFRNYPQSLEEMAELMPLKLPHEEEDYGAGPRPKESEE